MIPVARIPVLFLLLLLFFLVGCTPGGHAQTYRVIRVYDGDTLRVTGPGGDRVVRLIGIDCPEISKVKGLASQPYSRKATQFLKKGVTGKSLELKSYGQDKYDRLLAEVWAGGENLNLSLVRTGLAEVYRGRVPVGFSKQPYLEAQQEARRAKRAIWSLGERYVPPVVWKRQHPRP
jgi:endonuclease YncB( thermonuclease family)